MHDETRLHDGTTDSDDRLSTDDLVPSTSADTDTLPDAETSNPDEQPVNQDEHPIELFAPEEIDHFRDEWHDIQSQFVDDPRQAVQGADHLVAEVISSLATTFNNHKHDLEHQWQEGTEAQTEDLRQALRRYRTFFNQLLNA